MNVDEARAALLDDALGDEGYRVAVSHDQPVDPQVYETRRRDLDAFEAAIRAEGLDVERLARVRDPLAQALPGLVAAWDNDQTDNIGLAEVILRLIAAEYARLTGADRE